MTAPVALEVVADPPADVAAMRVLVDACSTAAGPGGCVLEPLPDDQVPRARVVVTFADGAARVHVERFVAAGQGSSAGVSREAVFRDGDPLPERFRAAGLLAASLVAGLDVPEIAAHDGSASRVSLRVGGGVAWGSGRSWATGELGGEFSVMGPLSVTLTGSYGETGRDAAGIAEERATFGAGLGASAPFEGERFDLRVRAEVEFQEVRANVLQPATGRRDEGGRSLAGAGAEAELVIRIAGAFAFFVADRLDLSGSETTVLVAGNAVEQVGPWSDSATAGLSLRLP